MTFDYTVGLVIAILLGVYLGYALIKPERF